MIFQLYRQMKAGHRPRVFRAGEQKRDFVYVHDVVALNLRAISAPRSAIYNCGSGQAVSFNEVIAFLNQNLGSQLEPDYFENPYGHFYQPHTEADLTLVKADLDFNPVSAQTGIADYVALLEGRLDRSHISGDRPPTNAPATPG
jgi:ADP-L-glycero-D-manno-heptose 6-epimerase